MSQVVRDKETRMRETLSIMSMSRTAYVVSYFFVQAIFVGFTTAILCAAFYVPLKVKSNEPNFFIKSLLDSAGSVFFAILLFGLSLIAMSLAFSTLFQDSKIAG